MKQKITMFMFDSCPHCRLARKHMDQLQSENETYANLDIKMIDEKLEPELADQYDYWYVPTYYVGDEKVHEGHAELEDVEKVFLKALGESLS